MFDDYYNKTAGEITAIEPKLGDPEKLDWLIQAAKNVLRDYGPAVTLEVAIFRGEVLETWWREDQTALVTISISPALATGNWAVAINSDNHHQL